MHIDKLGVLQGQAGKQPMYNTDATYTILKDTSVTTYR